MTAVALASLEEVALLFTKEGPTDLADALLAARGAYLQPSLGALFFSSRHPAAAAGEEGRNAIAIALDYAVPVGPQIDLLQLFEGKEVLPHAYLSPLTAIFRGGPGSVPAGLSSSPLPSIGTTAKMNALQSVKCSLFFRYRHPRDVLSLTAAEETALASAGKERRADLASAMAKLYSSSKGKAGAGEGGAGGDGVPIRVFAVLEDTSVSAEHVSTSSSLRVASTVLRQAWFSFTSPSSSSPTSSSSASSSTLTAAIVTCLQISERPPTSTAAVCVCGHTMIFPQETDLLDLASPSSLPRLLMPDGFVYAAFKLLPRATDADDSVTGGGGIEKGAATDADASTAAVGAAAAQHPHPNATSTSSPLPLPSSSLSLSSSEVV